ncbi:hypothetical protein AXFE_35940 [Acidithrix ferrooxidans]|uniref:Uncharacterized protein n=1 Tax=Acidithrix ferrooxidans TaxID=1280514 RepID=A0A0D8HCF6_9ACTN|nr:hypothetical protein AXFE_35940 [Acidithrix ferrooxidans]
MGALALSTVAVGLTGSAAWARTMAPSGAKSVISAAAPKLICQLGGTCATWAYWYLGKWCLAAYPNNENWTCAMVDMSFQPVQGPSGPVYDCIFSPMGSGLSAEVPYLGEVTIGGALFSCGWSAFGYYLVS